MINRVRLRLQPSQALYCVLSAVGIVVAAVLILQSVSSKYVARIEHDVFVSTSAFSQLVADWLVFETDRQNGRVLSAAEVMLLGDYVHIRVRHNGDDIVDARAEGWDETALQFVDGPALPARSSRVTTQSVGGDLITYAFVPLPGLEPTENFVHLGVRDLRLEAQLRNIRLGFGFGGFAAWLALIALGLTIRQRSRATAAASSEPKAGMPSPDDSITCGPMRIHRKLKTITLNDRQFDFPPKLFHLLEMLALEQDRAFNAEEILQEVWADTQYASANDVRQGIYRLRRQLNELDDGLGECISNVKGFGYRFDATKLPSEAAD